MMKRSPNITVAVLPMADLLEINQNGDFVGSEWIFLKEVLAALGLNYRIVIPDDGTFGRLVEGRWTGVIGMVHRGEADLACNTLAINAQRMQYIDFSTSYKQSFMTFAIERQPTMRAQNAYLKPFDFSMWMSLLVCLLVAASIFWIVLKRRYTFVRVILELSSNILKQPFTVKDGTYLSVKILLITWSYFSIVLGACYTGILLSFMTIPAKGKSVETLKELSDAVKKGTHRCLALKGSFQVPLLLSSGEPHLEELGKTIDHNRWYYSVEQLEQADTLIDQNTALILRKSNLERIAESTQKNIFISSDFVTVISVGIAINRNFCCKPKLNRIISRLKQAGIVDKIIEHTAFRDRLISARNFTYKSDIQAITIQDISGIVIFLIVGHFVAVFTLIGERISKSSARFK